jgi:hypothetical protein
MATITDAGLEYFAKFFCYSGIPYVPETTAIINKIRIGSGITAESISDTDLVTKYTDLGFQEATATTIEYLNTTAHPRTLHLQKVFTNSASVDREVWECGAFTSDGVCVARHVFQPYELENNNIVPVGQTITIDIYIRIDGNEDLATYTRNAALDYEFSVPLVVSASVGTEAIDPSTYACERGKICYNGVVLPNASPPAVTEARGGKTWVIKCATQDYTQVTKLVNKQGLVSMGMSVTGYQYATSLQRYGTLKIWDKTAQTHTAYSNCLIVGPVNVETFGLWYLFDLTIVQSYYGDL